jgi:hypothetical protein
MPRSSAACQRACADEFATVVAERARTTGGSASMAKVTVVVRDAQVLRPRLPIPLDRYLTQRTIGAAVHEMWRKSADEHTMGKHERLVLPGSAHTVVVGRRGNYLDVFGCGSWTDQIPPMGA